MALQDILKNTAAYLSQRAQTALNWYRQKVLGIGKNSSTKETDNVFKRVSIPEIGKMYIYTYNPLYREKLPFFDMYPLVIPLHYYTGPNGPGFLGLNLHYLPPLARASLLQNLLDATGNAKETERVLISYIELGIRAGKSNRFPGAAQCVKRYLLGHVVSSFHEVHRADWDHVVLLPLQKWVVNPKHSRVGLPY
jgi:hypothetical protein